MLPNQLKNIFAVLYEPTHAINNIDKLISFLKLVDAVFFKLLSDPDFMKVFNSNFTSAMHGCLIFALPHPFPGVVAPDLGRVAAAACLPAGAAGGSPHLLTGMLILLLFFCECLILNVWLLDRSLFLFASQYTGQISIS